MAVPSRLNFPLHPEIRERLRRRSKVLFGNLDRLEVAVAIAASPDGAVNATDLSAETGLLNVRVRAQLIALEQVGLLVAMPRAGELKRWYLRLDSPFWQTCLDLTEEWSRSDDDLASEIGPGNL